MLDKPLNHEAYISVSLVLHLSSALVVCALIPVIYYEREKSGGREKGASASSPALVLPGAALTLW